MYYNITNHCHKKFQDERFHKLIRVEANLTRNLLPLCERKFSQDFIDGYLMCMHQFSRKSSPFISIRFISYHDLKTLAFKKECRVFSEDFIDLTL